LDRGPVLEAVFVPVFVFVDVEERDVSAEGGEVLVEVVVFVDVFEAVELSVGITPPISRRLASTYISVCCCAFTNRVNNVIIENIRILILYIILYLNR